MYYTYMLRCEDHSIYTGMTNNLEKRIRQHLTKDKNAAKYTKSHTAKTLLAVWQSDSRSSAAKLEFYIKKLTKPQKERLVLLNDMELLSGKLEIKHYERMDMGGEES